MANGHWFRASVKTHSPQIFGRLLETGKHSGEAADDNVADGEDLDEVKARSRELFSTLCQYCFGEAMTILKRDRWCNPSRMTGVIRLSELVSPGKFKHLKDVDRVLTVWEDRVHQLDRKLEERLKIAVITYGSDDGVGFCVPACR